MTMSPTPRRSLLRALAAAGAAIAMIVLMLPVPRVEADPQTTVNKLMLVMDSSGSMKEKLSDGGTRIAAAKSALDSVIDGLPDTQQVGLRVYGAKVFDRSDQGACTDSQQVVGLGTDNRSALKTAVRKYKPYGETPTGYALQRAGNDLGSDGQRTIVLVSDGEPTCAPDPCAVAKQLGDQGIDLKIEVVGLDVSGKARSILQCIANEGHGHYYDADDADDIGAALQTVATRSLRPYQTIGQPITGTEQAEGAPALKPGDWLDEIGGTGRRRSELFYTLHRTDPGSTFHVSASLTTLEDRDGVTIEVFGDDEKCGYATDSHGVSYGQIISAAISAPGFQDWNEKCTENEEFTVHIVRSESGGGARTVPLEIRVAEEEPVVDPEALPQELPEPTYQQPDFRSPTKIIGGSSFAEATDIKAGAYSGNIVPGEVQIFQLPVDWGQHLTAAARIKPLTDRMDDEVGNPYLNVKQFSPSRAVADNIFESRTQAIVSGEGSSGWSTSYPVVYQNRRSFVDARSSANRAGNYYVAVSLSPDEGKDYQLPFTLGVSVDGTVQGAPEYGTSTPSAAPSSSPSPSPDTSATPTGGASTASATTRPHPENSPAADHDGPAMVTVAGWSIAGAGALTVIGGGIALAIHLLRRKP